VSIIEHLTEKPWLTDQATAEALHEKITSSMPKPHLGLRVFLGMATVVFSLFIIAYADRMTLDDWRAMPEPWVLWLNTAILFASSISLHRARVAVDGGRMDRVKTALLVGGGFAIAFLAGQLLAWQLLAAQGYFADTNPANAFFYLFTTLHAVHLLGGLVAWGRTTVKVWRGFEVGQVRMSVGLCAFYWHFLLLVWLVLFGLLLFT
jgi:cytochrome c oxidase subunit 3